MNSLDSHGTLRREPFRGSARARKGRARVVAFVIGTALFMSITPVSQGSIDATKEINYAKQLADYQLTEKQEKCHHEIVYRESRWNYKAKNPKSSAAGIPQLLNLKEPNPFRQIDKGLRYIEHRYSGSACKALQHHKIKGWY